MPERPTIHMVVMPKIGDAEVFTIEQANVEMERGYLQNGFVPWGQSPMFDDDDAARRNGWIPAIRRVIETIEVVKAGDAK